MRQRTLMIAGGGGLVDGSTAAPMSVVFANKTTEELAIVEGQSE